MRGAAVRKARLAKLLASQQQQTSPASHCNRLVTQYCSVTFAIAMSGHILRTAPKGQNPRCSATGAAVHQAVPRTESSQASSSGGVLSWFLGERPTTPVPALFEPLEGVNLPPALHSAGYVGGLGQPLMAPESCLGRLNGGVLHDFVKENYSAPRIVLAGNVGKGVRSESRFRGWRVFFSLKRQPGSWWKQ